MYRIWILEWQVLSEPLILSIGRAHISRAVGRGKDPRSFHLNSPAQNGMVVIAVEIKCFHWRQKVLKDGEHSAVGERFLMQCLLRFSVI